MKFHIHSKDYMGLFIINYLGGVGKLEGWSLFLGMAIGGALFLGYYNRGVTFFTVLIFGVHVLFFCNFFRAL